MITKSRDVNAGNLTSLKNRESFRDFNGITINENLDCIFRIGEMDSSITNWSPRREIDKRLLRLSCGRFGITKLRLGNDCTEEKVVRVLEIEETSGCWSHGLGS
jgi:hypothetical protein